MNWNDFANKDFTGCKATWLPKSDGIGYDFTICAITTYANGAEATIEINATDCEEFSVRDDDWGTIQGSKVSIADREFTFFAIGNINEATIDGKATIFFQANGGNCFITRK